jgi:hypothetical protein
MACSVGNMHEPIMARNGLNGPKQARQSANSHFGKAEARIDLAANIPLAKTAAVLLTAAAKIVTRLAAAGRPQKFSLSSQLTIYP